MQKKFVFVDSKSRIIIAGKSVLLKLVSIRLFLNFVFGTLVPPIGVALLQYKLGKA